MKPILLVEDDMDLGGILRQFLELKGYAITWEQNGKNALEFLKANTVAACIIDVKMPEMDGFTLAENICQLHPFTPFIFLTARNRKEDRLKGLGIGADDYITKPFEVDELLLRLKNILRRTEALVTPAKSITIGNYRLDLLRQQLHRGNSFITLTGMEVRIISYLYENKNTVIKRKDLLLAIWKADDYFIGRSFDVFLSRVRKYFQEDENIQILSYRNIGIEFKIK